MFGRLEPAPARWQLEFIRRLPHPREKVWRALIEADHLEAWFPTTIEGERKPGAALRFVFRSGEGPTLDGQMVIYEPPSLLEYRWGAETLRFHLEVDGAGTLLTFTNVFDELGKAARDAAGWHTCLDRLQCDLNGEAVAWNPGDRWKEVHAEYVRRLGPSASTVGPPAPSPAS